ncbi:MAG: hypothetical protein WBR18_05000 [Anaerolineales bacterium]
MMDNLRARAIDHDEAAQPPDRLVGLLDVNLLPDRYQKARISWSSVLAWLALIALIGLLVPSYQQWQRASARVDAERLTFSQAQVEMQAIDPNAEARAKLQEQIDAARSGADALRSAAAAISIQDVQWGQTIASLRAAQGEDLRLTGILVEGGTVQLSGDARSYSLPLDYAAALRSNGEFLSVVVDSISKIELPPEQQAELADIASASPAAEGTPVPGVDEPVIRYAFQISVIVQIPETPAGEVTNEGQ